MQTLNRANTFVKANSPAILTGVAIFGVSATGVLSFKAGHTVGYDECINDNFAGEGYPSDRKERAKFYAKRYWRDILPPATAGALTITSIVLSSRIGARRAAAATAAYALTEQTLGEYREKVIEKFGEKADGEIKADIAQDRHDAAPPSTDAIIVTGSGTQMCMEGYTGRYFLSDMELLRRAQNDINAQLISQDTVTLSDWYHLIGLSDTSSSHDNGWTSDKMMALEFSAVLTKEGNACMVFDYNYVKPVYS